MQHLLSQALTLLLEFMRDNPVTTEEAVAALLQDIAALFGFDMAVSKPVPPAPPAPVVPPKADEPKADEPKAEAEKGAN